MHGRYKNWTVGSIDLDYFVLNIKIGIPKIKQTHLEIREPPQWDLFPTGPIIKCTILGNHRFIVQKSFRIP